MGNLFSYLRRCPQQRNTAGSIVMLPISSIEPANDTPRRQISDTSLSRLADSIRLHGVVEPLSVARITDENTADPHENQPKYRIISGNRRIKAAKIAGLSEVPCVIVPSLVSSAEAVLLDSLTRADLTMFEEAEALAIMISELSLTQEQAARRLSCSQSAVANKLRLLKLTPAERTTITDAGLTERHARSVLRLRDPDQRSLAIDYIIRRRLNVAQTEEYVDALVGAPGDALPVRSPSVKGTVADVQFFYNSIDRAVELANSAGIPAHVDPADDGLLIRIE